MKCYVGLLCCFGAMGQQVVPQPALNHEWELVFNDDFAGGTLDTHNWNRIPYVSWGVSDWRKYQSTDASLVEMRTVEGESVVTLWGRYGNYTTQNNQESATLTNACGGITTQGTFSFQYGYVEVRAKFDSAYSVWPAIWLMPVSSSGWLPGGEIDMMEHLAYQGNVHQTLHYEAAGGGDAAPTQTPSIDKTQWNTYGMEWTPDRIVMYINETVTATFNKPAGNAPWPFDDPNHEFYLIIDQQWGGDWVNNTPAEEANKGAHNMTAAGYAFDVDYVRVYADARYMHLIIPEPASVVLAAAGLCGLGLRRRRR